MANSNKILIATYYRFPCSQSVLENVFAKELGRTNSIYMLFKGKGLRRNILRWHNSCVILCREIPTNTPLRTFLNRLFHSKLFDISIFYSIINLISRNKIKIVCVRDMPLITLLLFPLRPFLKFKIYYQYSAPMGDIKIGYSYALKNLNRLLFWLLGHLLNILTKLVLKKSDIIFPISEYLKKEIVEKSKVNITRIIPLTMGIDKYFILRRPNSIPFLDELHKENFLIVYFGTLSFARNPQFIIQVFAKFKENHNKCKLLIIGKTQYEWEKKQLIRTCKTLKVNNDVIFTGLLQQNLLFDYISCCDVSLSAIPPESYYRISSPTKLYESLGIGLPVIGNKGILEQEKVLKESGGGFLVDYDVDEFSNAIATLMLNKGIRKKMSKKGKKYILNNYSYQAIAKKISPYFENSFSTDAKKADLSKF